MRFHSSVLLSVLVFAVVAPAQTEESEVARLFRTTPIFGQTVTLTPEEYEAAERWPVTRVLLYKQDENWTFLVIYRSHPATGKTAALFHRVLPVEGWAEEFNFIMAEVSDGYWVEEQTPDTLLALHRGRPLPVVIQGGEWLLQRGHLIPGNARQGFAPPRLVLGYTSGKTLQAAEVSYPVLRLEALSARDGFVAEVGHPAPQRSER